MTEQDSGLFELDDVTPAKPPEVTPMPVRDEQVAEIREAFETAGIASMEDRRALIESCVLRPVGSLRDLRAREARGILDRIRSRSAGTSGSVTAWSDRSEETWIDKL